MLKKNICIVVVECFPILKHCILIGLCEMAENFCTAIFRGGLTSPPLIQNSYNKILWLSMV